MTFLRRLSDLERRARARADSHNVDSARSELLARLAEIRERTTAADLDAIRTGETGHLSIMARFALGDPAAWPIIRARLEAQR